MFSTKDAIANFGEIVISRTFRAATASKISAISEALSE
jgi:hypothetical protein